MNISGKDIGSLVEEAKRK